MDRRAFMSFAGKLLSSSVIVGFVGAALQSVAQEKTPSPSARQLSIEEWMNDWMQRKPDKRLLGGRLFLSRFVEPVYFLTEPISWKPVANQVGYAPVIVPKGFVTDFASIPRVFWTLLRPDGNYAHAAIVHDFLYWDQSTSRQTADSIFKFAMQDLKIAPMQVTALYDAVRLFGEASWLENASLKARGGKRIMKKFPDDPTTRWKDWKTQTDVFF